MLNVDIRNSSFFRVGTVGLSKARRHKPCSLNTAARHNLREIQAELGAHSHINSQRTQLNLILSGHSTAAAIVEYSRERMQSAGIDVNKLRCDHVQAVELLFSLAPNSIAEPNQYFDKCLFWVSSHFGEGNVLSAVVHHDESAPHCHILLLPLVGDKMNGGRLIDKVRLRTLHEDFTEKVAIPSGQKKGPTRLRGGARADGERMVRDRLRWLDDVVAHSCIWPVVQQMIASDPAIFMDALAIELPDGKRKITTCGDEERCRLPEGQCTGGL